jgi:hypothetical protein
MKNPGKRLAGFPVKKQMAGFSLVYSPGQKKKKMISGIRTRGFFLAPHCELMRWGVTHRRSFRPSVTSGHFGLMANPPFLTGSPLTSLRELVLSTGITFATILS